MPEFKSGPEDEKKAEKRESMDFTPKTDFGKAAKSKSIATHTVAAEETLSHIALTYYGNAGKPYYMNIYEANKKVIGDNPNIIKPGMELEIPELPDELK